MPKKASREKALRELASKINGLKADLSKVNTECLSRVLELLSHPNTKLIKRDGNGFRVSGKYYKGLTVALKEQFWSSTEEDPKKRSKEDLARRRTKKFHEPSQGRGKCKGYGARHGTKVHAEVCRLVRRFASKKAVKTIPAKADPCTIRIFNLLAERRWFPIGAEICTFDPSAQVATAMDIALIDVDRSKVIAGELKTGFGWETYDEHPTDLPLDGMPSNVKNCPKNRHAMQLLGTVLNFKENYNFEFDDAVVLWACPKRKMAEIVELPEWARDPKIHSRVLYCLQNRKK